MDRTSGQPQVNLDLLHSNSLKFQPLYGTHICFICTETVHGHEQLISNGGRVKLAERDKKQTMKTIQEISTNWFKTSYIPP
jgi:hypothetical protein